MSIVEALRCGKPGCTCTKNGQGRFTVHCPAHADGNPSLSVKEEEGRILVHCFAGCAQENVINSLRDMGVWPNGNTSDLAAVKPVTAIRSRRGLTLAQLAEAKQLPEEFLRQLGIRDCSRQGAPAVRILYMDAEGEVLAVRYRIALDEDRFRWQTGNQPALYGLDRLIEIRQKGWVLLVEGESDCWTLWYHGLPALGIPGKSTWRAEWSSYLTGLQVYLWQEPDAEELPLRVGVSLPDLRVIVAPSCIKDISEAHLRGRNIPELVECLKREATPVEVICQTHANERIAQLERKAASVLEASDPLVLVDRQFRELGYGGETRLPMVVYVAATTRVLMPRSGAMPAHLLIMGTPSSGKSYTVGLVQRLFPPEAFHTIDAGSPRVLIYDTADLRHRVIYFGEADSLPAGEDNPAASAVRGLLQENRLRYQVTERDPDSGGYAVREINKPGPSVLMTTSTRPLGDQLMSRLFVLETSDDPEQIRLALMTQARLEKEGVVAPDPALVAYQAYLQERAPWDVSLPFVDKLARAIGRSTAAPRILRDFARLLSLIKAVAVLRHRHRKTDDRGRIIAELEDYDTVRSLVNPMYEQSTSGASEGVRRVVQAVKVLREAKPLGEKISVTDVARQLGISKMSASRLVKNALQGGWLVNNDTRRGHPYDLGLGEPLPEAEGLPSVEALLGVTE